MQIENSTKGNTFEKEFKELNKHIHVPTNGLFLIYKIIYKYCLQMRVSKVRSHKNKVFSC